MKTALLATLCALLTATLPGLWQEGAAGAGAAHRGQGGDRPAERRPDLRRGIGQTRGSTEIEVRARVEGFIETVDFKEGHPVKKGQLLYTIDSQPFEAALAQAKGQLAEAEAQLARATQDVVRYEPLVAKNAISRQEYETAVVVKRAAEAAVDAARASAERAQIDLSYTRVLAPDDGLAGKTEVYPGTLVGRGQSTLLTHISQVGTIHVRFTIPERDYLFFARRREERGASDQTPNLPFELVLADGSVHPRAGRLVFVDRNVDPTTGTILMEAAFPNPGSIVRPGQYARVRAAVDFKKGAILVPQRAVSSCRASTASPSSRRTTRSRSGWSRRPSGSAPCG